jgi:hypothetical protein
LFLVERLRHGSCENLLKTLLQVENGVDIGLPVPGVENFFLLPEIVLLLIPAFREKWSVYPLIEGEYPPLINCSIAYIIETSPVEEMNIPSDFFMFGMT